MPLIQESARQHEAAPSNPPRYRSPDELMIRAALEEWGRARWPDRRVLHELGMGRGSVRADVVFAGTDSFSACEIKSAYDNSDRLVNQLAVFRLSSPEVWLVSDARHGRDAELMGYLLPSIGLMEARVSGDGAALAVLREPGPFSPDLDCMLSLLWVEELRETVTRLGIRVPARATHTVLRRALMEAGESTALREVCRGLLGRRTLWRADPPVPGA